MCCMCVFLWCCVFYMHGMYIYLSVLSMCCVVTCAACVMYMCLWYCVLYMHGVYIHLSVLSVCCTLGHADCEFILSGVWQRWGDGTSLGTLPSPHMLARMTTPKSTATHQYTPFQGLKDGNSCVTAHVTLAEGSFE